MTSPYLTIKEVATLLRSSEKTVYRQIKELPGAFKFGGTWLVDKETLMGHFKNVLTPKAKGHELSTDNRHDL